MNKQQFIDDLSTLVSYRSLTANREENNRALSFIKTKLNKKAVVTTVKNGDVISLIAANRRTKTPDVCYLVHADVVAAKPEQFAMKVKKGIAYGRGVSDMKFSIPLGYALLNELIETNSPLSFALVVTTDEETGGFKGAQFLANTYKLKPKLLLVPDGGDNFEFISKGKGVCALKIESCGIPAHASQIWEGKNALEPLVRLCNTVLERYANNNRRETWKTTVNIGKLEGGISANQVCPEAYAILDFRFPETSSFDAILKEVRTLAKKIDPTLKISIHSSGEPTRVDMTDPAVKLFLKTFAKRLSKKVPIRGAYGASDARHFAKLNVPILMIKPVGGDIHGDSEHINIDSCLEFYDILRDFLTALGDNKNYWR